MCDVERLDRPTQYRLLESVPDGPFWRPGALAFCGPRFRLLEAYQDPYDSDEASFSWDADPKDAVSARTPSRSSPRHAPISVPWDRPSEGIKANQFAPDKPQPATSAPSISAQPASPGRGSEPAKKKGGASFARKAWNATKYVSGLTKHLNPMGGGDSLETTGKLLGWNEKTPWIDKAQDIVSLVGVVDPTGIADVANALVYGARGKFGDAAISLAGVVPVAGDSLKLLKFGRGAAKEAAVAGRAAARTEKVASVAAKADVRAARKAAREGSSLERLRQTADVTARRRIGRQGRTAQKALTGKGTLRGKAGKLDADLQKTLGSGYQKAKSSLQQGFRDQVDSFFGRGKKSPPDQADQPDDQGADQPTGPEEKKPTPPAAAEPQDVPPHKPEGPLARKTTDDPKPEQPAPEPKQEPKQRPATVTKKAPAKKAATAAASTPAAPASAPTGGSQKTPRAGRPMVPVDEKCPPPTTKTSKWGVKPGFKRCHGQTANRKH